MAPFDWFTSDDTGAGSDDELWGASGSKSPFDPCPKGWRVPAYSSGNKSPWNHFLDSWSGFPSLQLVGSGDGTGIVFGDYPSSNVVGLGFYPYNFERIPRDFSKPGSVGSNPGHVTGGLFPYVSSNDIYGHYWTANAESGTPNAKGMYINFSPFESVAIADLETPSRAYGAFVRCVKE